MAPAALAAADTVLVALLLMLPPAARQG
jgi:hypothetical protein